MELSSAESLIETAREVLNDAKSVITVSENGSIYDSRAASVVSHLEDLEQAFDDNLTAIRGSIPPRMDNGMSADPHARIQD
jgi:hypothetical protein